jgi:hypothetical protein
MTEQEVTNMSNRVYALLYSWWALALLANFAGAADEAKKIEWKIVDAADSETPVTGLTEQTPCA